MGVRGSGTIVPRGSATRNRLAGKNGKKLTGIVYIRHGEFIEHELRGFAQKVLLTCVRARLPIYMCVCVYVCVSVCCVFTVVHAKSFTAVLRMNEAKSALEIYRAL